MISPREYTSPLSVIPASIASGTTTSAAINIAGATLVGIHLPATLTGTSLSFQAASSEGGTYQPVTGSSGGTYSLTVSGGKFVLLNPADFAGIAHLKLVSNASEAADRNFELVVRPV